MRNAAATKERILEAALAEFSAHGIAGARVDRIAQAARCNKNLIYIYFEDKETLFTTVLRKDLMRIHSLATAWSVASPFGPSVNPRVAERPAALREGEPAWCFRVDRRCRRPGSPVCASLRWDVLSRLNLR